jgi:hypothetical protein
VPENHVAEASLKWIMNKPELDSQDRRSVWRTPSGVTLSSKRSPIMRAELSKTKTRRYIFPI